MIPSSSQYTSLLIHFILDITVYLVKPCPGINHQKLRVLLASPLLTTGRFLRAKNTLFYQFTAIILRHCVSTGASTNTGAAKIQKDAHRAGGIRK
jgi:hypothetical protein